MPSPFSNFLSFLKAFPVSSANFWSLIMTTVFTTVKSQFLLAELFATSQRKTLKSPLVALWFCFPV
jgi:hypothetical protein